MNFELRKTNNTVDGWHRVFEDSFKTSIYRFTNLINQLKDEEEVIRQKDERIRAGHVLRRNERYLALEQGLLSLIEQNTRINNS